MQDIPMTIYVDPTLDSDEYTFYNEIAQANPFRYRSYYFDTETGFYYLPARYYDPAIGRFKNKQKQCFYKHCSCEINIEIEGLRI